MKEISFYSINRADFPDDVHQCGECCALVLSVNTAPHADWHAGLAVSSNA